MAPTARPRVAGELDSELHCRDPTRQQRRSSRGIANDPMTVEVELAGRIDGIADAAG
jgi:hypothetical protein